MNLRNVDSVRVGVKDNYLRHYQMLEIQWLTRHGKPEATQTSGVKDHYELTKYYSVIILLKIYYPLFKNKNITVF